MISLGREGRESSKSLTDGDYGGLKENGPNKIICLNLNSAVVDYLGRIERCGLIRGVLLLGVGFEAFKAHAIPRESLPHTLGCFLEMQPLRHGPGPSAIPACRLVSHLCIHGLCYSLSPRGSN